MKKLFIYIFIVIFSVVSFVRPADTVLAYSPAYIITDEEFLDYSTMNQLEIYRFLARKKSFLATYKPEGFDRYASFIIYDAAQKYKINPQVILTMLQKEQSLVENTFTPSQYRLDWAMGYGMCDSCSRNTPGINKFQGFKNQIYMAAKRLREYYDYPYQFRHKGGQMAQINGQDVMILNQATAALYNYTPHLHGNKNFWKIWQRWFVKNIPNGSIVQVKDDSTIWLIRYGQKRRITSMSVLMSKYDLTKLITVSPTDLAKYEEGTDIRFHQYALLQDPKGGKYLLIDEDTIRPLASEDVFRKLGYNEAELIDITWEDIQTFHLGQEITMQTAYPHGTLLKYKDSSQVYYVKDGYKHPLLHEALLDTNFKHFPVITVESAQEIDSIQNAEPIIFADGTLIKSVDSPSVYVIDEGQRRPILSGKVFENLGYSWESIYEVSEELLQLHLEGKPVD